MRVTVRDRKQPDRVIGEFKLYPQVQLPYINTLLVFPREAYQGRQTRGRVADYVWDLESKETGDLEIQMIVAFE